jgi:putative ABC transport system permease protein
VRATIRRMRKKPFGLVASAVAILLGVGLNLAIGTLLYWAFWQPLPYKDAGALVAPMIVDRSGQIRPFLTDTQMQHLRAASDVFSEVASLELWPASRRAWMEVDYDGQPRRIPGAFITPNLFEMLGVQPVLGRALLRTDAEASVPAVVISHDLWLKAFDATPDLLNTTLQIHGEMFTVVGVLPRGFLAPVAHPGASQKDLSAIQIFALQSSGQISGMEGAAIRYLAIARLQEGRRPDAAAAVLNAMMSEGATGQSSLAINRVVVSPLRTAMLGEQSHGYVLLAALSGLLLVVALSTVAAVVWLRQLEAFDELAVKAALGASRWHIWKGPVFETCVLSAAGGAAAALGVMLGRPLLVSVLPPVPWADAGLPPFAVGLAVVLFVFVATAVGTMSIQRISRHLTLESGQSPLVGRGASRTTTGFLSRTVPALQLGVMIVIGVPALALWSGIASFQLQNPHLDRPDVVVAEMWIPTRVVAHGHELVQYLDALADKARSLPGVVDAGFSDWTPLLGPSTPFTMAGLRGDKRTSREIQTFTFHVDRGFFDVLDVRLLYGRLINSSDTLASSGVAIVSRTFALRAYGTVHVVGERMAFHGDREIVGVAEDVNWWTDGDSAQAVVYVPRQQDPSSRVSLFVRLTDPTAGPSVSRQLVSINPLQPVDKVHSLATTADMAFAGQRLYVTTAGLIALSTIVIGVMAVYLVTGYTVRMREQEIGIRMALGSTRGRLLVDCGRQVGAFIAPGALVSVLIVVGTLTWLRSAIAPLALPGSATVIGFSLVFVVAMVAIILVKLWKRSGLNAMSCLKSST